MNINNVASFTYAGVKAIQNWNAIKPGKSPCEKSTIEKVWDIFKKVSSFFGYLLFVGVGVLEALFDLSVVVLWQPLRMFSECEKAFKIHIIPTFEVTARATFGAFLNLFYNWDPYRYESLSYNMKA